MNYPFPVLRLNITLRCNLNCPYCSVLPGGQNLDYTELPPEKWIDVLSKIEGSFGLIVSGGEPGLYQGLPGVINSFIRLPLKLYTNASIIEPLLQIKPRKGLGLYVSYQYGKIKFETFKKNMLALKKHGLSMSGTHTPTTRRGDGELMEQLKDLKSSGLSTALDHPFLGWGGDITARHEAPPAEEMSYYDHPGHTKEFAERKTRKRVTCEVRQPFTKACMFYPVSPDGRVWFCMRGMIDQERDNLVGNIFDVDFKFDPDRKVECDNFGWCNICDGFGRRRTG